MQERWELQYSPVFREWWDKLTDDEQESIFETLVLLRRLGPHLPYPHSSAIRGSRHGRLRELRIQHRGRPFRILYAFDPRRIALLLAGGEKTGNDRWYDQMIPVAGRLYTEHLAQLQQKGMTDV